MELVIKINLDNAAFTDQGVGVEVSRILADYASKIEAAQTANGLLPHSLRDLNGNVVGNVQIEQESVGVDFSGTAIAQIQSELDRLGLSTDTNPSSGLMVEATDELGQVHIYDDYADGNYDPRQVLRILRSLSPFNVSLASEDPRNIWELIRPAEF